MLSVKLCIRPDAPGRTLAATSFDPRLSANRTIGANGVYNYSLLCPMRGGNSDRDPYGGG